MRLWVALIVCAACSKKAAPPPTGADGIAPVPAAEVKRGQDACGAYVAKVCACAETHPEVKEACGLSHALPEAIGVALQTAQSAESTAADAHRAQDAMRKTVKSCIEETAKLAAICP